MKRFLLCVVFLLGSISFSYASVFLVGRNIALTPTDAERTAMFRDMGHSYIIIIPDESEKVKQYSWLYAQWEKDIGCGQRGVIVGAYAEDDANILVANLQVQVNASREREPTQAFLCGTSEQKAKWNFTGGEVKTELVEEEFIHRLLLNVQKYIFVSKENPVDYHALRSVIERAQNFYGDWAQNCNAFAFSLLVYSGASELPQINTTKRIMPGRNHLLASNLFYEFPRTPGSLLEKLDPTDSRKKITKQIQNLLKNLR